MYGCFCSIGIGMNHQPCIGIGMAVLVEYYLKLIIGNVLGKFSKKRIGKRRIRLLYILEYEKFLTIFAYVLF